MANTFPAAGNVGIGTTTPGAPLHIFSGSGLLAWFQQDPQEGVAGGSVLFDQMGRRCDRRVLSPPFDDPGQGHRWWPDPGESIAARDWDNAYRARAL